VDRVNIKDGIISLSMVVATKAPLKEMKKLMTMRNTIEIRVGTPSKSCISNFYLVHFTNNK